MKTLNLCVLILFASFLTFLTGCGSGGPVLAPVTGTVKLDGEPIAGVELIFEPVQKEGESAVVGPFSIGSTNESGEYKMIARNGQYGAVVGEHRVSFSIGGVDPEEMMDELKQQLQAAKAGEGDPADVAGIQAKIEKLQNQKQLPDRYQGEDSIITANVKPGDNKNLDFNLESGPQK
ncbi:MAG: hypothetical protein AAF623_00220 [Planctomycetota bacterium]